MNRAPGFKLSDCVGKSFTVPAYDGIVRYVVDGVETSKGMLHLSLVDGGPDGYSAPIIGESCWISAENVVNRLGG